MSCELLRIYWFYVLHRDIDLNIVNQQFT